MNSQSSSEFLQTAIYLQDHTLLLWFDKGKQSYDAVRFAHKRSHG